MVSAGAKLQGRIDRRGMRKAVGEENESVLGQHLRSSTFGRIRTAIGRCGLRSSEFQYSLLFGLVVVVSVSPLHVAFGRHRSFLDLCASIIEHLRMVRMVWNLD